MAKINGSEYDMTNPYDNAAYYWELAKVRLANAKQSAAVMVEKAQENADNAERELAKYELAPGLPDPHFLPFQENGLTMSEINDQITGSQLEAERADN